jgi:S-adenosyl-L-methionine hydrolase (adenosine-forming)
VDITHHVQPFDTLDGAIAIGAAYRYFPARTIHVVIVDPGVGTDRRPLLMTGETQYFIAPDNGVLSLVFEQEPSLTVRHVNAEHYFLQPVSRTFHGRDIFAPVAAWLSKGAQTASMGEEISDYKRFALPKPKAADGLVTGTILRADHFGNLLTNFKPEDLPEAAVKSGTLQMVVNGKEVKRLVETFAQGEQGEPVAIVGSSGYIEIAVNKGSAAQAVGARRGAAVVLTTT